MYLTFEDQDSNKVTGRKELNGILLLETFFILTDDKYG